MEEYDYKSSDDNESSHECNIIFQDKAESDDDEASLPGLMVRDNIKESDYESDDEFYMPGLTRRAADNNGSSNSDAACLFYKNMVLTNSRPNNKKARANVIFTLEYKHEIREHYLGLLDIGSTGGLISKELVDKYDFTSCIQSSIDGGSSYRKTPCTLGLSIPVLAASDISIITCGLNGQLSSE